MKSVTENQSIEIVPMSSIVADPDFNSRKTVEYEMADGKKMRVKVEDSVEGLAQDIEEHGLLSPLTVTKKGKSYHLVAGFRRYYAISKLGWPKVEVKVIPHDDLNSRIVNIKENIGREAPLPLDLGRACIEIQKQHKLSGKQLEEELGYHRNHINYCIKYAKLPAHILAPIDNGVVNPPQSLIRKLCYPKDGQDRNEIWAEYLARKDGSAEDGDKPAKRPSKQKVEDMLSEVKEWRKLAGTDEEKYSLEFLKGCAAALNWAANGKKSPVTEAPRPEIEEDEESEDE